MALVPGRPLRLCPGARPAGEPANAAASGSRRLAKPGDIFLHAGQTLDDSGQRPGAGRSRSQRRRDAGLLESAPSRASYNGITSASQADDEGSTPFARSIGARPGSLWIRHRTTTRRAPHSTPSASRCSKTSPTNWRAMWSSRPPSTSSRACARRCRTPILPLTRLAEIVELEPLISGRLIGMANSVAYERRGMEVRSVKVAVTRLGINARAQHRDGHRHEPVAARQGSAAVQRPGPAALAAFAAYGRRRRRSSPSA